MPEPSAKLAAKNAWLRMRSLIFPFRPGRWLTICLAQAYGTRNEDATIVELRRIRPYYRGTRIMTTAGLGLILLAFIIPFLVLFVTLQAFAIVLIVYAVLFVAASLAGMAVQSALDAIFALAYEGRLTFRQAMSRYLSVARSSPDLAAGYMSIKMTIDFSLSTLALGFFLPALLSGMALMIYITGAVTNGTDMGAVPYLGLLLVATLALLGLVATLLVTLPAAAFYGYYTEEIVKQMKEACPEAIPRP